MKKLWLILALVFTLSSCSQLAEKSADVSIKSLIVDAQKNHVPSSIRAILLQTSYTDAQEQFAALSPEEQVEVWNDKLLSALSESKTIEQFNFINEVRLTLSVELFKKDQVELFDQTVKWYETGLNVLGQEMTYRIFGTIFNVWQEVPYRIESAGKGIVSGGEKPTCKCEWDSSCSMAQLGGCDAAADCKISTGGCGWFWQFNCTGMCDEDPLHPLE